MGFPGHGHSHDDLTTHEHGDKVAVGIIEIELLHTPGIRPAARSFLLDGRLVAGDTLFWRDAAVPISRAAMSTRCFAASSSWHRWPVIRPCFRGTGIRSNPARACRVKRSNYVYRASNLQQWRSLMGG